MRVLVTGAGRGSGRAVALAFAGQGDVVAAADLDAAAAVETAGMAGGGAIGLGLDVADAGSVREAVADVAGRLGGIDVLVNNAGLYAGLRRGAFFELDVAPPLPMSLADVMADKTDVWNAMVQRHGLVPTPYGDVSSWPFGDFVFSWDYDVIADTSKSRRAGFH